ncbi:MAG: hypothetical protein P4M09_16930 [Devosia sp.]|nr:hypothetical protein [Devosia sp.]
MPSCYLSPDDVEAFGLGSASDAQIAQASTIIDSYLIRPEGVVWCPDAAGAPCYMAAKTPQNTVKSTGSIAPGASISIPISANLQDKVGAVVILDRANPDAVEACIIQAVAAGTIILAHVAYAHGAATTIDFGLVIEEERSLPSKRSITRASKTPVARLLSGVGRYGYGRRSDQIQGLNADFNLLATIQTFGGPPQWIPWDVNQAALSNTTGELWVPAGILLAYFSDVRVWYVAGWPADQIPYAIKSATATVLNLMLALPEMSGNIRTLKAGDTMVQRFKDTILDADTKALLNPYRAQVFG